MLFYWIIFFIVLICAFGTTSKDRYFRSKISIFILGILGCTRDITVGMDVESYCLSYLSLTAETFSDFHERLELGFLAFMLSMKSLGVKEPMIFIYSCFIVFWICNIKFINRYCSYVGFAVFLVYSMGYYFEAYNTVRQMLCHAIILCFIPLLEKHKYKYFIFATILVSLLFHKSQIIMVFCLFPFVVSEFLQKNISLYIYIFGSLLLGLFLLDTISGVFLNLSSYIGNSTYSSYLMDTSMLGDLSFANLAFHSVFSAFLVFYSNGNNCGKMSRIFLVISVLGQAASNILSPVSWILARAANSLCYFRIIPITEMYFSKSTKNRRLFQIVVIIYFAFRFYGRLVRDGIEFDGDVIPYVSILHKIF